MGLFRHFHRHPMSSPDRLRGCLNKPNNRPRSSPTIISSESPCREANDLPNMIPTNNPTSTSPSRHEVLKIVQLMKTFKSRRLLYKGTKVSCPVDNCQSLSKDLEEHIRKVHRTNLDPLIAYDYGFFVCGCGITLRDLRRHGKRANCKQIRLSPTLQISPSAPARREDNPQIGLTGIVYHASVALWTAQQSSLPSSSVLVGFQSLVSLPEPKMPQTIAQSSALRKTFEVLCQDYLDQPSCLSMFRLLALPKLSLASGVRDDTESLNWVRAYPYDLSSEDIRQCFERMKPSPHLSRHKRSMTSQVRHLMNNHKTTQAAELFRDSLPMAPPTEETLEKLKLLHPHEDAPNPTWDPTSLDPQPPILSISKEAVNKAIRELKHPTSGGVSSFNSTLVRTLSSLPCFQALIQYLAERLASGSFPHREMLLSCKLIALQKPNNGVRPIAMGEVFYKLAAISFLNSKPIYDLPSYQFGVGTPYGVEPLLHIFEELCPDWALLSIDLKNAFNSVNRQWIWDCLIQTCPHLLFPFSSLYGTWSTLYFGKWKIYSKTGVKQGDPFGPLLFSLAYSMVLKQIQPDPNCPCPILAYLDDTYLFAPEESVHEFTTQITNVYRQLESSIGLHLRTDKTTVTLPGDFARRGIAVLGSHVGGEADEFLKLRLVKWKEKTDALLQLHPADAIYLLRCHFIPELVHLQRTLRVDASAWNTVTEIVNSFIITILHQAGSPLFDPRRLPLPIKMGGLGFGYCGALRTYAVKVSQAQVYEYILTTGLGKGLKFRDIDPDLKGITQQTITRRAYASTRRELRITDAQRFPNQSALDRTARRIHFADLKSPLAYRWLLDPLICKSKPPSAQQFAYALAIHLRATWPLCQLCHCPNVEYYHLENCGNITSIRIRRHDAIRDFIVSLCEEARVKVKVEPTDRTPDSQLRADLTILDEPFPTIDFAIPSCASQFRRFSLLSQVSLLDLLRYHTTRKLEKYDSCLWVGPFIPIVISTMGSTTPSCHKWLSSWGRRLRAQSTLFRGVSLILAKFRALIALRASRGIPPRNPGTYRDRDHTTLTCVVPALPNQMVSKKNQAKDKGSSEQAANSLVELLSSNPELMAQAVAAVNAQSKTDNKSNRAEPYRPVPPSDRKRNKGKKGSSGTAVARVKIPKAYKAKGSKHISNVQSYGTGNKGGRPRRSTRPSPTHKTNGEAHHPFPAPFSDPSTWPEPKGPKLIIDKSSKEFGWEICPICNQAYKSVSIHLGKKHSHGLIPVNNRSCKMIYDLGLELCHCGHICNKAWGHYHGSRSKGYKRCIAYPAVLQKDSYPPDGIAAPQWTKETPQYPDDVKLLLIDEEVESVCEEGVGYREDFERVVSEAPSDQTPESEGNIEATEEVDTGADENVEQEEEDDDDDSLLASPEKKDPPPPAEPVKLRRSPRKTPFLGRTLPPAKKQKRDAGK